MKKQTLSVSVDEDVYEWVRSQANEYGVPLGSVIKQLIIAAKRDLEDAESFHPYATAALKHEGELRKAEGRSIHR